MTELAIYWPQKTRELQNHHMDSTRWNDFSFRDDDIFVSTWAKSGTTWTQQILGQLIFDGAEGIPIMDIAAWIDMRVLPLEEVMETVEAQQHRRFLKTHLPIDALVFSPQAKYIFIARDGRDTFWSLYNHHSSYTDEFYRMLNETPGLVGPTFPRPVEDIRAYFHQWLDQDAYPYWEFFGHTQGWFDAGSLPNVLLVHFNNLKADLPGEMRRIAAFLDIEIDESLFPTMVEHCTFEYMREHSAVLTPMLEVAFQGGGRSFVHKGTNGRWRDTLTKEDLEKYDRVVSEKLSPECAHWLATGELPDGMQARA